MRYEDWDILLFPGTSKAPIKEFKVACHVIHDPEFPHTHTSYGLPTVCCFVPSLPAGWPFQVSIHSWVNEPGVSEFTKSHTKYPNLVRFEARLFIDGRIKTSVRFDNHTLWPQIIPHGSELSKNGEREPLRFPTFRQELLQHSYWSPADDIGRIKIVISETFPRDSPSMPLERVKNIVAFSFQHAPLDILESSAIAWPNPSMWHREPLPAPMPILSYPSDDPDLHTHSPHRRANEQAGHGYGKQFQPGDLGFGFGFAGNGDQFGNVTTGFDWACNTGTSGGTMPFCTDTMNKNSDLRKWHKPSTDTSMPDYASMPEKVSRMVDKLGFQSTEGHLHSNDHVHMGSMKAPNNTPTHGGASTGCFGNIVFPSLSHASSIPADLANSLTNSLLNQPLPMRGHHHAGKLPAMEVRSRKEALFHNQGSLSPSTLSSSTSTSGHEGHDVHKVSQQRRIPTGASLPVGTVPSQINSPQLMGSKNGLETGQRAASMDELRTDMANECTPEAMLRLISGNFEKGTKRAPNFTSALAKVIDEEDDPRRHSPGSHLTPFPESIELGALE